MKIFSPTDRNPTKSSEGPRKTTKAKRGQAEKAEKTEKAQVSDQEIREKLAAHVETSNGAKSKAIKSTQPLGAGFMNAEAKPNVPAVAVEGAAEGAETEEKKSLKESHLLMSDVKLNDPKDSNTQEKLKSILRNGAFSFNPKEKDTLERILGGN